MKSQGYQRKLMAAEDLIAPPVAAILAEAAKNPNISLQREDVSRVTAGVVDVVAPIVEHATNTEAWWRSRVTVGSIAGVVGGVITIATGIAARSTEAELYAGGISAVVGGGLALYGRWLATRPIGR